MPVFPISWKLPLSITLDERDREILKLKLNNQWTLVCVTKEASLKEESMYCCNRNVFSFEIHRKNTDREISVLGELKISMPNVIRSPITQKEFSVIIEPGSSLFELWSDIKGVHACKEFKLQTGVMIEGLVKVFDTSLADGESKERNQLKSLEKLSKDLERVMNPESSCFTDVTLKCGGVSILAHKFILTARSPVFAAMFAHPMKESQKNEVDITDIDVSLLRALLKYMYTGKTSDLNVSLAADLLFAADKYELEDLKTECTYFLKNAMSLQNVLKILVLGDLHSKDLKSVAVDYICNCDDFSVLEKTQEWKALRKERYDLAMELLESLVKYRDVKLKH